WNEVQLLVAVAVPGDGAGNHRYATRRAATLRATRGAATGTGGAGIRRREIRRWCGRKDRAWRRRRNNAGRIDDDGRRRAAAREAISPGNDGGDGGRRGEGGRHRRGRCWRRHHDSRGGHKGLGWRWCAGLWEPRLRWLQTQ